MSAFSLSSLGPLKHATGLNKQPLSFIPLLSVCDVNDIPGFYSAMLKYGWYLSLLYIVHVFVMF